MWCTWSEEEGGKVVWGLIVRLHTAKQWSERVKIYKALICALIQSSYGIAGDVQYHNILQISIQMWKIKSSLNRIQSIFTFFIYTGNQIPCGGGEGAWQWPITQPAGLTDSSSGQSHYSMLRLKGDLQVGLNSCAQSHVREEPTYQETLQCWKYAVCCRGVLCLYFILFITRDSAQRRKRYSLQSRIRTSKAVQRMTEEEDRKTSALTGSAVVHSTRIQSEFQTSVLFIHDVNKSFSM